jgi:hypothetical protein
LAEADGQQRIPVGYSSSGLASFSVVEAQLVQTDDSAHKDQVLAHYRGNFCGIAQRFQIAGKISLSHSLSLTYSH